MSKMLRTCLWLFLCFACASGSCLAVYLSYATFLDDSPVLSGQVRTSKSLPVGRIAEYWFPGNLSLFFAIGSGIVCYMLLSPRSEQSKTSSLSEEEPDVEKTLLRIRPARLDVLAVPTAVLFACYQIPYLVSAFWTWQRMRENIWCIGLVAAVLLFICQFLYRRWKRHVTIGDELLELEFPNGPIGLDVNQLRGQLVLSRSISILGSPIRIKLICNERRNWPLSSISNPNQLVNIEELYWESSVGAESIHLNPFEAVSYLPFTIEVPDWLPRPWVQKTPAGDVGIFWKVSVQGRIENVSIDSEFSLDELQTLAHAKNQRIVMPRDQLANLLEQQGILWQLHPPNNTTHSICKRPSNRIEKAIIAVLLASVSLLGILDYRFAWTDVLWFLSCFIFAPILAAYFIYQNMHRQVLFEQNSIIVSWTFLRWTKRKQFLRSDFRAISIEPIRSFGNEQHGPVQLQFEVSLERDGSDNLLHLINVKNRMLAKGLGHAIAHDLGISVTTKPPSTSWRP